MHTTAKSGQPIKSIKNIGGGVQAAHASSNPGQCTPRNDGESKMATAVKSKPTNQINRDYKPQVVEYSRSHTVQSQQRTQRYARPIMNAQQRPPPPIKTWSRRWRGVQGAHTTSVTVASAHLRTGQSEMHTTAQIKSNQSNRSKRKIAGGGVQPSVRRQRHRGVRLRDYEVQRGGGVLREDRS